MYLYVRCIDSAYCRDFFIGFWDCSDIVVFFLFFILSASYVRFVSSRRTAPKPENCVFALLNWVSHFEQRSFISDLRYFRINLLQSAFRIPFSCFYIGVNAVCKISDTMIFGSDGSLKDWCWPIRLKSTKQTFGTSWT